MAHLLCVCVYEEVRYERWRVEATGEVKDADSAAGSKPMGESPLGHDVVAGMLYDRFVLGLTATKCARQAVTAGLGITTQTIYRVSTQFALAAAAPMVARMPQVIVGCEAAQSDESWLCVRRDLAEEGRRNSVMWLVRTSEALGIPPVVVLCHAGTRAASALANILRGLSGSLMADGYRGYPKALRELADAIELVGCLQHARSKFVDALQALGRDPVWRATDDERRAALPASRVLDAFAKVFGLEGAMPDPACGEGEDGRKAKEARCRWRERKVIPAMDRLFEVIDLYASSPLGDLDDYLGKALRYATEHRERFYKAARGQVCPLTNTACEREFADLATIRNASRQIDSVAGAWTLALWSGLCRTARANGADELCYLNFVMERARPLLEGHGDWVWRKVPNEGGLAHRRRRRPARGAPRQGPRVPRRADALVQGVPRVREGLEGQAGRRGGPLRRADLRGRGRRLTARMPHIVFRGTIYLVR